MCISGFLWYNEYMNREDKIDIIISKLTQVYTAGPYGYLEREQTHGDIDNAHKLFENKILKKEINDFFYKAEAPVCFTANELLIYHKFNPQFEKTIVQGYTEESLQYLMSLLFEEDIKANLGKSLFTFLKQSLGEAIENYLDDILESIKNTADYLVQCMQIPQFQLAPVAIGGASTEQEIVKDNFFYNFPDIPVCIKTHKDEIFIEEQSIKECRPISVFTVNKDGFKSKVYPLTNTPDGYTCKLEFDNDLRYGLFVLKNKE